MPPFLLGDPHGDARMGISRVLGLCAALLFASSVTAANIIDLGPSDYRNFGPNGAHTSAGIRSSTGQTVRLPPTLGTLTVTRNPVIPYGSVANGLRNFVRVNPASIAASAAVTGLFLAVDWVWDEASGTWGKTGLEPVDPEGGIYWTMQNRPTPAFSSPEAVCEYWYAGIYGPGTELTVTRVTDTQFMCTARNTTGPGSLGTPLFLHGPGCPAGSTYDGMTGQCVVEGFIDLSPDDWAHLESELPGLPAPAVAQAAGDAQRRVGDPLPGYQDQTMTGPSSVSGPETTSTSTDPVTGDSVVTSSTTTTNISYGDTSITTTNTTVTNTYTNGQHTGSETVTETPGELPVTDSGGVPPVGDWPGFCDWATVVCDWFDWTQEEPPPDVDLPQVIDDDFFSEKTISFGAKSCPPDHEINLAPFLETTVGVSFQPLCDFAGLIYYMVMAASYIIAAYISIGVARNG